eukprot:g19443.t1
MTGSSTTHKAATKMHKAKLPLSCFHNSPANVEAKISVCDYCCGCEGQEHFNLSFLKQRESIYVQDQFLKCNTAKRKAEMQKRVNSQAEVLTKVVVE